MAKSSKKSSKKATKVSKSIPPSAKISFLKARPAKAGGPKTELLAMVPRKGSITFAKLKAKAEAGELKVDRVPGYLLRMAAAGRVAIS